MKSLAYALLTQLAVLAPLASLASNAARAETWIDLTHSLSSESVFWPTAPPFELRTEAEGMTDAGYYYSAYSFSTSEHGCTADDDEDAAEECRPGSADRLVSIVIKLRFRCTTS